MPPVAVAVAVPSLVPQSVGFVLVAVTLGAPGAVIVTEVLAVQELASVTVTV